MKKKILSLIFTVIIVATCVPMSAQSSAIDLTEGSEIWVLEFNYFRYDGDYSDLYLDVIRTEGNTIYTDLLPFRTVNPDTNYARIVHEFEATEETPTVTIAIRRGDEVIDYEKTIIDLANADENRYITIYALQDSGLISTTPIDTTPSVISVLIENNPTYDNDDFKDKYTYNGNDLGASYSDGKASFKLWAPTVSEAQVLLYDTGLVEPNRDDPRRAIDMVRGKNGTWAAEAASANYGELNGKFYTYRVLIDGEWREGIDPYANAVGVNGDRGQLIDLAATNPDGWENDKRPELKSSVDAVIYELHVRDLSTQASSGIVNKGKFLGIAETGTTSPAGLSTGLDHIIDLGVTHVHLLPSYDYATVNELYPDDNEFNWGYDPQNYNTPEGSYSTNAEDGSVRVAEFKHMVKTLHDNNIGVIMDVVYNHMYDVSASSFNTFVPGYYFRMNSDGTYSNGSGCGNETASEREMMRKFMVDSVVYWATEYHVDGFRFDLMGLHDIETMNIIRAELDKIDPSIIIYGEGWTSGSTTLSEAQQAVKKNMPKLDSRIAAFSNDIRDGIKGSVFNSSESGFVNGDISRDMDIRFGIVGSVQHPQVDISKVSYSDNFWANEPTQTITYASSHDNLTLWDKLTATNPNATDEELEAMNKLAAAIVLTSQGTPFFQAGEEMARTKNGDDNSYKSHDRINQLNWDRKGNYIDLYEYYKGLIALRKATPEFRMTTADEIREKLEFFGSDTGVVSYTIGDKIAVVFNGNDDAVNVTLPADGWDIVVNEKTAGTTSLDTVGSILNAAPKGAYVLFKNDSAAEATSPSSQPQPLSGTTQEDVTNKFPFNTTGLFAALALICCALGGFWFFFKKKKK